MIGDSDIRIRVDRVLLRASMPKVNVVSYALEENFTFGFISSGVVTKQKTMKIAVFCIKGIIAKRKVSREQI